MTDNFLKEFYIVTFKFPKCLQIMAHRNRMLLAATEAKGLGHSAELLFVQMRS